MSTIMLFRIGTCITAVTYFSLGMFVFLSNKKSIVNKSCLYFNLSVTFWSLVFFSTMFDVSYSYAFFACKLYHFFVWFCPFFFYRFVVCFVCKEEYAKDGLFNRVYFILLVIYGIITLATDFVIKDALPKMGFPYYPLAGNLYFFLIANYVVFFSYPHFLMANYYPRSTSQKQVQMKYFFVALFIGWSSCLFLFPPLYNLNITPFPMLLLPLFTIITTYAIFKHKLLDIEVVIKKTLVFAGLLAATMAMLVLPTILIQEYIFRNSGFTGRMIGLTIGGLIIVLTVRRIEDFLIKVTDKYLFQKKYDYKELLKTFTSEVLTVLELYKLMDLTVSKLSEIIKLNSCAVLLLEQVEDKDEFYVASFEGVNDPAVRIPKKDGIAAFMHETHGYILMRELGEKKVHIPDQIQGVVTKLNAELVIPLVLHEELIGMLSLGKKKSDEEYTQDDLDILLPLASTLAIAIANAQLFDKLGKTQAEAAQKEKMAVIGTLSAGINHEICNPLGIARGQCEAYLLNLSDGLYKDKTPDELISKAKEIMTKVIKETDRATIITKRLSNFAKPSKGEMELVDVNKALEDVIGLVGYELKLDKIEFERNIQSDLPQILVDKKQFEEVLFNLIRNAGQAIGEKGKISLNVRLINNNISIDIADTGYGIPPDKLKQLFNPFFTTKEPGKGTGLGLFIVRQVVEKNGGRIFLKSTKVGEGTTFTVEFPPADPTSTPAKPS